MKKILLYLLSAVALFALDEKSCFTIQLLSKDKTYENYTSLENLQFAEKCKIIEIGESYALRCGCYAEYDFADVVLPYVLKDYPNAFIAIAKKDSFTLATKPQKPQVPQTPMAVKEEAKKEDANKTAPLVPVVEAATTPLVREPQEPQKKIAAAPVAVVP
ncbi:MAG: hypothetical protein IE916_11505, partial [Epsilonproteobacteria bacterium]|nr:hypothetical protein [Campylobacterota bacterium]